MDTLSRYKRFIPVLTWLALTAVGGGLLIVSALYLYLSPKLPSVETLREVKLQTPLRIYSQDLHLISEFGEMKRTPIAFEQIPENLVKAILAAEDDRFFEHGGVDMTGLLRAAVQLAASGSIQSGGSTITMQVARNFFLTRQQTFTRKFNEILLSLRIEQELTKNEILTLYANKIYLGKRAYGVEAAANVYYGKSVAELSLAEMAMIAGLPKAPSAFNPIANPKRAVIRRNWILGRMEKLGYIDNVAAKAAITEPVTASYHGALAGLNAPYVAEMARAEMLRMYGLKAYSEGFTVYTTVDSKLHESARSAVIKGLKAYDQRHGYRGAERHIPNPEKWGVALEDARIINGLIPAIVTEVEEKALVIQTKFGNQERLEWDQGLEGLRQFITENRRSSAMKDATEWFKPGDQIRISRKEDRWYLDQIPAAQAALVSLNPKDGGIRALVGGFSFEQSNYNRATQAERQPGSNFKPFIYATALENGFTAASVFNDAPIVFEDRQLEETWRPENDSGKFYGPTRLRKALYLSRNLVSIRLLKSLGIARGIIGAERFGFDGDALPRDLSLALGTHAVPPLSIATGYATLANGGFKVEPYLISEVQDIDGNSVYKAEPATVCQVCEKPETTESEPIAVQHQGSATTLILDDLETELGIKPRVDKPANPAPRVLDERVAYIMDSILKDVIKRGTGTRAKVLGRNDIAGKTGTTNGPRDAWFSGYGTGAVTTTWVGFDQNQLMGRGEYGGSAALPIWIDFMADALKGVPEVERPRPPRLVTARINPSTGQRVGPGESGSIFEYFLEENQPPMQDSSPGSDSRTPGALPEDIFQ